MPAHCTRVPAARSASRSAEARGTSARRLSWRASKNARRYTRRNRACTRATSSGHGGAGLLRGSSLGMEEHVGTREIATGLHGLGLGHRQRTGGERLEHVLDDVLRGQALDQLRLLEAHGGLVGNGTQQPRVLVAETPAANQTAEDAQLLVPRGQRRDQQPLVLLDPANRSGGAVASRAAQEVEHQSGPVLARARFGSVGRVGGGEHQVGSLRVEAPDLARVRPQKLARAAGHGVVEILSERHRGE